MTLLAVYGINHMVRIERLKISITVCTAIHEMDTYMIVIERTSNENIVGLFYMQRAFPVTHAFCSWLRSGV